MSEQAVQYPWYQVVETGTLEQGDILRSFEVLVPQSEYKPGVDDYSAELKSFDLVIMTQSCDLEQGKTRSVLLCPLFGLWDFVEAGKTRNENWGPEIRERLRIGNLPGYHLLNEFVEKDVAIPLTVVDFHEVYSAPTWQVKQFADSCGPRLRVLPPYKEHLAQAFARFFMRVGLPVGIPKEKLRLRPTP